MKWKITTQFLVFMILSLLLSIFVFLLFNVFFLYSNYFGKDRIFPYQNPTYYTLDFANNIQVKNEEVSIPDSKLGDLEEGHIWIQVLDENGTEIYSHSKPEKVPTHYTPAELIHYHKFTGALENSTIYIGMLEKGNRNLSYIMGYPEKVIGKAYINYRTETLVRDVLLTIVSIVLVVTLIALIFGYFFSRRLANPIVQLVEGIQKLAKGDFWRKNQVKGVYKTVFENLNKLSDTLQFNEVEHRKLEKIREEWITNITHDIKTPLSSIKGYSELLQDYELDNIEKKRYVDIILNKSNYIEHLIDDLNLTYKLKGNAFPVKKTKENIIDIVRESVIQILNHPLYEETNLVFSTEIEQYSFRCDRTLIQRALMNLIYNAIVHNPPDTFIQASIFQDTEHIKILIEDNGNGIEEGELENLFSRYYRGTNTGESHKGSGLGLAIAKEIVEAHGGKILVESKLGEGTRITIVF
ncbi:HAMP domain-containing sensor histidine kinase [Niallia sp. FSL W8-1348]|uniref:HAMP domain-containing sensor histidine kinase n=1 Tax=Niallia sp. FSL W8-1348 TaxID=2954656 RepID=UPI0030FA61F1